MHWVMPIASAGIDPVEGQPRRSSKLLWLPMGVDVCYTNHAEADQDAAGPACAHLIGPAAGDDAGDRPRHIITVRGMGFRFDD